MTDIKKKELNEKLAKIEQEKAREIYKWGEEYCDNPDHNEIAFPPEIGGGIVHKSRRKRRRCKDCWEEVMGGNNLKKGME